MLFSVNHATDQSKDRNDEERNLECKKKNGFSMTNNFLSGGDLSAMPVRGQMSDRGMNSAIQSPSSLLSAMRNNIDDSQQTVDNTVGTSLQRQGTMIKSTDDSNQSTLISTSSNSSSSSSSSSSNISRNGNSKDKSAMKKGFLDSGRVKQKPIYPESGSGEGSGGSKGGALARVMDKCHVINMADMSSTPPIPTEFSKKTPNTTIGSRSGSYSDVGSTDNRNVNRSHSALSNINTASCLALPSQVRMSNAISRPPLLSAFLLSCTALQCTVPYC